MINAMNSEDSKAKELDRLKKVVIQATKNVEVAQATYEAFTAKSNLFQGLLDRANEHLDVANNEFSLTEKVIQNLESLTISDSRTQSIAGITNANTNDLLAQVGEVVNITLTAASAILQMSRLVTERKAANPLISSELVSRANEATAKANGAVQLIISTLASMTNALASSSQARDSMVLVGKEINELSQSIIGHSQMNDHQRGDEKEIPLSESINRRYREKRSKIRLRKEQLNEARNQEITAKDNLNISQQSLQQAQAALAAAQAVIGS